MTPYPRLFLILVATAALLAGLLFGLILGRDSAPVPQPSPTPTSTFVSATSTPTPLPVATSTPTMPPRREVRAVWAYASDYNTADRRERFLHWLVASRLTRVQVLVYSAGRAHYPSRVAPTRVAEATPDALSALIADAHAESIEVYAYLATMVGRTGGREDTIVGEHPEWALYDSKGRSLDDYSRGERESQWIEAVWLDPGHPEVGDYVEALYSEVLERYPVDGVQLDFIRYPSTYAFTTGLFYPPNPTFGYNPAALAAYKVAGGSDPLDLLNNRDALIKAMGRSAYERACWRWDEWRRERVTEMVRRVAAARDRLRPGAKVAASVIPFWERAYLTYYQDWPRWVRENLLDEVYPMSYTIDSTLLERVARSAVAVCGDRDQVVLGLAVYKNRHDVETLLGQMNLANELCGGWSLFSSRDLRANEPLWEALASTETR